MIPRREEAVDTTPLSPRVSDVSDESDYLEEEDYLSSPASEDAPWHDGEEKMSSARAKLRHAVGIALLLATVLLWTASNFLASVRIHTCSDERGEARGLTWNRRYSQTIHTRNPTS
jgi:solute carrier family 35 protein F5